MVDAALELLDQGLSVIPVKASSKRPYIKWKKYQKQYATPEEVERWWTLWPNANIAIVTGAISKLVVVDADGPKGIQWIWENLPRTGVYVTTAHGMHAYYLLVEGMTVSNAVRLTTEVDVRGDGGYVVAPPSIHQSGHQYAWHYEMDGWDNLAEYKAPATAHTAHQRTQAACGAKSAKTGNLNLDLGADKTQVDIDPVPPGERNNTLARLCGRWYGKGLDEEEVQLLAVAWNSTLAAPLPEKEVAATVTSIGNTHAHNHPPDPDLGPTEHLKPAGLDGLDGDACCQATEIPGRILHPGGLLEQLMEYIENNSAAAVPYFSLASALTFVGNLIGQKVMTETGLRTNLYTVSLGYSGSGKNAALNTLPQLLIRTTAAPTMGPTELTSSTAILAHLAQEGNRVCMMMLDEFGSVLKGLKNPNSAAADIPRLLTKLFSSTDRPEMKAYSDPKYNKSFPYHHLSLYAASTPERFWSSLEPGDITDGFLARVLIFESLHDAPMPKATFMHYVPEELIAACDALADIKTEWDTRAGNLMGKPMPNVIAREDDAAAYFNDWALRYFHLKNETKEDQTGIGAVYGRVQEHAAKLALIHAMSMTGPDNKTVTFDSVKWACDLMDYQVSKVISAIEEKVIDNDTLRDKIAVFNAIKKLQVKKQKKKNKKPWDYAGVRFRDIARAVPRLTSAATHAIIKDLIQSEHVGVAEVPEVTASDKRCFYVADGRCLNRSSGI